MVGQLLEGSKDTSCLLSSEELMEMLRLCDLSGFEKYSADKGRAMEAKSMIQSGIQPLITEQHGKAIEEPLKVFVEIVNDAAAIVFDASGGKIDSDVSKAVDELERTAGA